MDNSLSDKKEDTILMKNVELHSILIFLILAIKNFISCLYLIKYSIPDRGNLKSIKTVQHDTLETRQYHGISLTHTVSSLSFCRLEKRCIIQLHKGHQLACRLILFRSLPRDFHPY